jgi:predicted ABC-type sugar transport system permease subunit
MGMYIPLLLVDSVKMLLVPFLVVVSSVFIACCYVLILKTKALTCNFNGVGGCVSYDMV